MTKTEHQLFVAFKTAMDQNLAITFTYKNQNGEIKERHILPQDVNVSVKSGRTLINALDLLDRDDKNGLRWKRFLVPGVDADARVVLYEKPPRGYAKDKSKDELLDFMDEWVENNVFMELPSS